MSRKLLDPVAAWRALSPLAQQEIGAAAIATELSIQGALADSRNHSVHLPKEQRTEWLREADRYENESDAAHGLLQDLLIEHMVDAYAENGMPHHIDLNPLGIRQCTQCGCTEDHACEPGPGGETCGWAGPTLCTACLPATSAPEPPDAVA